MQKPKIILTVGAPASGKTTWAVDFCKQNTNFWNLNRDDLRELISPEPGVYKFSKSRENRVTDMQFSWAKDMQFSWAKLAIYNGMGVVVSDTNLNKLTREKWEVFAKEYGLEIEYKVFDEPIHVLLKRNRMRPNSVPDDVIYRMARQMREYLGKPVYNPLKPCKARCVIFDVDGTLAHMNGNRGPYDFEEAIDDSVDKHLAELVVWYKLMGHTVIIMTGRESNESGYSEVTKKWLDKHSIPYDRMYCRKYGDHRNDAIVKEELFFDHVNGNYRVSAVYDDRDQVVHMWRSIGVKCFQVAYGNF